MSFDEFKDRYKINDKNYYSIIEDLIKHDKVLEMDSYIQHGKTTTLDHCITVSYRAYKKAKLLKFDYKSVSRAALLHDFFLYDWHDKREKTSFFKKHGFTHPETSLSNSKKYFSLTNKEEDIIAKHMWPLTIRKIPKNRESMLVCLIDKTCSFDEIFSFKAKKALKLCLILIGIRI